MAIALAADTRPSSSQPYTLLLFWDLTPIGHTALSVDGLGALEFTRHVRTEAGVRRYRLPIGAPIGGRKEGDALSKLVVKVGNRNAILRRNADGSVERRNGDRKTWRAATSDEAKLLSAAEKGHQQRHAEIMSSLKGEKPKPKLVRPGNNDTLRTPEQKHMQADVNEQLAAAQKKGGAYVNDAEKAKAWRNRSPEEKAASRKRQAANINPEEARRQAGDQVRAQMEEARARAARVRAEGPRNAPATSNVRQLPTKAPAKPPVKAETPAERNRRLIAEEDARNAARNPNRERSTAELAGMSQAERDKYRNAMTMSLAGGGTPEQRRALKDQMDQADLVWSRNPAKPDAAKVTPIGAPRDETPRDLDAAARGTSAPAPPSHSELSDMTIAQRRAALAAMTPDQRAAVRADNDKALSGLSVLSRKDQPERKRRGRLAADLNLADKHANSGDAAGSASRDAARSARSKNAALRTQQAQDRAILQKLGVSPTNVNAVNLAEQRLTYAIKKERRGGLGRGPDQARIEKLQRQLAAVRRARGLGLSRPVSDGIELSAKTAFYSTHHHELGTPGGPGLWRHKGWQLPDYITNVAKGVMESGQLDKSKAIEIAVGKVRDWAEGKGNVSPEVRAAAAKAIAEWDAKRAATKATKLTAEPAQEIEMAKPMFGGKTPTAKDVRDMVSAHGKVPAPLRDKYRKRVIGHARKANAMHHIPPAWLKGSAAAKG